MSEPEVRIRYWIQDTMESGHWEVTGLMSLSQAKVFAANRSGDYQIVQDEEGFPLFEEHKQ